VLLDMFIIFLHLLLIFFVNKDGKAQEKENYITILIFLAMQKATNKTSKRRL
jgi:hypothetical protein